MKFLLCLILFGFPFLVSAQIVINEIAWMGTGVHYTDEWIELYNNDSTDIDLTGWILSIVDKKEVVLEGNIPAGDYYLIERTDDETVPSISADLISSFGTGLTNTGAILILKDGSGGQIDKIDASESWLAGNNNTKETMQKSGSGWITAPATPKAQNSSQDSSSGDSGSSPTPTPTPIPDSDSGWPEYVPPEERPSIKAYAGKDMVAVVGALAEFRGMAYDYDNNPLERARFLWNFGDGTTKEGKNILHYYRYPGEYRVVLNASLLEETSSDYMRIKVVPGEIYISEITVGSNSFIELQNRSKEEINISRWILRLSTPASPSGGQSFIFPQNSFIRSASPTDKQQGFLVVSNSVSNIILNQGSGVVELLYPGNFLADSFEYSGVLTEGQSFSRGENGASIVTSETPGRENETETVSIPVVTPFPVIVKQEETKNQSTDLEINYEAGITDNEKKKEESVLLASNTDTFEHKDVQQATVITVEKGDPWGTETYILIVSGTVILAGLGVFLIRRNSRA